MKLEKIDYSLEPRRAIGAGHVESDVEEAIETLRLKVNELISAVNSLQEERKK